MNVIPRAGWAARPPRTRSTIPLPVKGLFLHHTAGSESGAEGMRRIQAFHMDPPPRGRGWADIGYSWVYDPRLRTFYEARGPGVAGAHTKGHNTTAHALAVMGDFNRTTPPPSLVEDLTRFAAWHRQWGPGIFTGGHRDVANTSCPGDRLYRLIPNINRAATDQETDVPLTQEDVDRVAGAVWDRRLTGGSSAGLRLVAIDDRTAKLLSRESAEKTADELGVTADDVLDALHRRLAD